MPPARTSRFDPPKKSQPGRAGLHTRAALALILAAIPAPATAAGVDVTTSCLPPANSAFIGGQLQLSYGGGILLRSPVLRQFTSCDLPPPLGGATTHYLNAEAGFEISADGGLTWVEELAPARVTLVVHQCDPSPCPCPEGQTLSLCGLGWVCLNPGEGCVAIASAPVSTPVAPSIFDTQLLQLDILGGTLPSDMRLRIGTAATSSGQVYITDLGGGSSHVEGFFDVFTELSLDAGQTWIAASSFDRVDLEPDPNGSTAVKASTWGFLKLLYR